MNIQLLTFFVIISILDRKILITIPFMCYTIKR